MNGINVAEIMGASPVTKEKESEPVKPLLAENVRESRGDWEHTRDPRYFIDKQKADLKSAEIRLNAMIGYLEDIYSLVNSTDHNGTPEIWEDYYKDLNAIMCNCIAVEKHIIMEGYRERY